MTVVPAAMVGRWQRIVDLLAELLRVPAGLVMEADPPVHRVLVTSDTPENPYRPGDGFLIRKGLYCDTVMTTKAELLVRDAGATAEWRDNPDLEFGMSFYLGLPLLWPDGRVFGTICVLDRSDNERAARYRELLAEFRGTIENDLALIATLEENRRLARDLRESLDRLEERVAERTAELGEANAALRVLLRRLEESRHEIEQRVMDGLCERVLPHLPAIRAAAPGPGRAYVDLLESGLRGITSTFSKRLSATLAQLTPAESEVAQLIAEGHSTKDIARIIGRAVSTVEFHRNNVRRKLGLESQRVSLRGYLSSMER